MDALFPSPHHTHYFEITEELRGKSVKSHDNSFRCVAPHPTALATVKIYSNQKRYAIIMNVFFVSVTNVLFMHLN